MLSGLLGRALLVGADGDFAAILGPSGEIDSLLVVAWGAVTRDVYQQTMHPDLAGETLTGLSRRVTLVLALVALAVARLAPGRTIFWYVIFGWSGVAATFCPSSCCRWSGAATTPRAPSPR